MKNAAVLQSDMFKIQDDYLRAAVFGIEDALISTTGMVTGVSIGSQDKQFILLASLVAISVGAISLSTSQYFSEKAVHQMECRKKFSDNPVVGSVIMFVGHSVAGLIPILPIIFFSFPWAIAVSVIFSFLGLYLLGFIKGELVKVSPNKSALEMFFVGGLSTLIGVVVGLTLKI